MKLSFTTPCRFNRRTENKNEHGTKHLNHHQSERCNRADGEYVCGATAAGLEMPGMLALALTKAYELRVRLTLIAAKTDSSDPNLTTLNDVLASLTSKVYGSRPETGLAAADLLWVVENIRGGIIWIFNPNCCGDCFCSGASQWNRRAFWR
jgi:hypothetical protein